MDIILHAKVEYTKQLQSILRKSIISTFSQIFEESKLQNDEILKTFQIKMTNVPNWNQDTIHEKYNQITSRISEDLFEKLLQAIIVSNVKIFGSIKKNQHAKIEITLPDNKQFVHKIYVNCARAFYQSPSLFENRRGFITSAGSAKNSIKISKIVDECVEETIRNVLPFNNILEEYFKEEPEIIDDTLTNEEVDNAINGGLLGTQKEEQDNREEEYVSSDEDSSSGENNEQESDVKQVNLKDDEDEEDDEFYKN